MKKILILTAMGASLLLAGCSDNSYKYSWCNEENLNQYRCQNDCANLSTDNHTDSEVGECLLKCNPFFGR